MCLNLWEISRVHRKGCRCVDYFDVDPYGDGERVYCGMCLTTVIRFVHVMEHDAHSFKVEAGSHCAEMMGEGYAARERDREMSNRAERRRRWPFRRWKPTPEGGDFLKARGKLFVISPIPDVPKQWTFTIDRVASGERFDSVYEAMMDAFDLVWPLRSRRTDSRPTGVVPDPVVRR
jgi:hypothetical protein